MNSASSFSRGDSLHSMNATLIFKLAINTLSLNDGNDLLETTHSRGTGRDYFNLPPPAFGKTGIHAKHFLGEKGRLVSTGPCPNFEKHILLIIWVFGKEKDFEFFFALEELLL